MLYPKNKSEKLSMETFRNPTSEYRGTPFWAWNCALDKEQLARQIDCFKEMHLGGFHMHVRTGMSTTYLSKEYFELIKHCVEKARKEEMLAWLYDEDRWPSGAAGGLITKDKKYRARHLLFTPFLDEKPDSEDKILLGVYDLVLDDEGYIQSYERVSKEAPVACIKASRWYAYLELQEESPWYNNQTYINTLDKASIDEFCRVTHEAYKREVGEDFGGVVPAIFTDEPQFTRKTHLGFATDKKNVILPWTNDLPETFKNSYGMDIMEKLPELFFNPKSPSQARYFYHDHISERFAQAFSDNIGEWCGKNNLALTGHMMEEPTLHSQTAALGEVMRSLSAFQLPGIDMLCDQKEYTTAKQAQSVAHQYGREGVLSELYGVTDWDFDFRGHKLQGDWQAALGVTVRVPHLSWVSMEGEAKRDYPASISYQSPWYKEYAYIEDHFARVNTALTRGKPLIQLGVIHPVESYWLHWGPEEQSAPIREQLDKDFLNLASWLLLGQLDFNYISESLLPRQNAAGAAPLQVGQMEYNTILVPGCQTIRSTTLDRLEKFAEQGGKLIFVGNIPELVDALPSDRAIQLSKKALVIRYDKYSVLQALEAEREISIFNERGLRTNNLLTQLREDNGERWLFISHSGRNVETDIEKDVLRAEQIKIILKGQWQPTLYDTQSGETRPLKADYKGDSTIIRHTFYAYDSLLLNLSKGLEEAQKENPNKKDTQNTPIGEKTAVGQNKQPQLFFKEKLKVSLSEPNALLLDLAEYSFDGGEYQPLDEVLRIDDLFRQKCGYPERSKQVAQPWVIENEVPKHELGLRFCFESEIEVEQAALAIERPDLCTIQFNGEAVEPKVTGWYVDESILTIPLPKIVKGSNTLEFVVKFGKQTNTEWCYIIGDFGVKVEGAFKTIVSPVRTLAFGDVSYQGLPFYGGNIDYHFQVKGSAFTLHANQYRGALIGVTVDGKRLGSIVYPPYDFKVSGLEGREHEVVLTLFGNRHNSFSPVHLCDKTVRWFGPDGWRTRGDKWSYEYNLKPLGILKSPEVFKQS